MEYNLHFWLKVEDMSRAETFGQKKREEQEMGTENIVAKMCTTELSFNVLFGGLWNLLCFFAFYSFRASIPFQ
jgi:hypothetical protein